MQWASSLVRPTPSCWRKHPCKVVPKRLYTLLPCVLQAIGLEQTSATRGAFLTHTTALFTPLIDGLAGGVVSLAVWGATALGAVGTVRSSAVCIAHSVKEDGFGSEDDRFGLVTCGAA